MRMPSQTGCWDFYGISFNLISKIWYCWINPRNERWWRVLHLTGKTTLIQFVMWQTFLTPTVADICLSKVGSLMHKLSMSFVVDSPLPFSTYKLWSWLPGNPLYPCMNQLIMNYASIARLENERLQHALAQLCGCPSSLEDIEGVSSISHIHIYRDYLENFIFGLFWFLLIRPAFLREKTSRINQGRALQHSKLIVPMDPAKWWMTEASTWNASSQEWCDESQRKHGRRYGYNACISRGRGALNLALLFDLKGMKAVPFDSWLKHIGPWFVKFKSWNL